MENQQRSSGTCSLLGKGRSLPLRLLQVLACKYPLGTHSLLGPKNCRRSYPHGKGDGLLTTSEWGRQHQPPEAYLVLGVGCLSRICSHCRTARSPWVGLQRSVQCQREHHQRSSSPLGRAGTEELAEYGRATHRTRTFSGRRPFRRYSRGLRGRCLQRPCLAHRSRLQHRSRHSRLGLGLPSRFLVRIAPLLGKLRG